jgi:hypothetical protein
MSKQDEVQETRVQGKYSGTSFNSTDYTDKYLSAFTGVCPELHKND